MFLCDSFLNFFVVCVCVCVCVCIHAIQNNLLHFLLLFFGFVMKVVLLALVLT